MSYPWNREKPLCNGAARDIDLSFHFNCQDPAAAGPLRSDSSGSSPEAVGLPNGIPGYCPARRGPFIILDL